LGYPKSRLQRNPLRKQVNAKQPATPVRQSEVEHFLQAAWRRRGVAASLLLPFSWVYRLIATCRRLAYEVGLKPIQKVDALVLVVGNVIVGGAGKTPTVISIVKHLQARGLHVGVISRGYGRDSIATQEVRPKSTPAEVGDEPALVQRATGAPVVVGAKRVNAAQILLARYPQTQIVVCDDGLQHYALHRDLEICVFDNRGCGNGWLLPAGPLREPWPRLAMAQAGQSDGRLLVLHTGTQPAFGGYRATRTFAPAGMLANGTQIELNSLISERGKPLFAVAGISQPQAFFDMLDAYGIPLAGTLALPDHYGFDSLLRISDGTYRLICTEKDAQKLWQVAPDSIAVALVQTAEAAFWTALDKSIDSHLSGQP
jgi:tetraacyldisaccharide 4'-kinase